jgi:hypothetical protein
MAETELSDVVSRSSSAVIFLEPDAGSILVPAMVTAEYAQQMAAHESARTTKLYDRRNDLVTLDQVERIVL